MPHDDAIPGLATARELHPSSDRADRPIGIDAIESIALGLAAVVGTPTEQPARGEVHRHRVIATAAYDAWIVTVGPQTAIEPHDHDGSIGVIAVTDGHLIEFGLDDDAQRRSRLRHLIGGDRTQIGITHRHSLANPDLVPATTVQVFSPPLGHDRESH
jgi:hypothetical protein